MRVLRGGKGEFSSSRPACLHTVARVQEERRWEVLPLCQLIVLMGLSVIGGSLLVEAYGKQLAAKLHVSVEFTTHVIAFASFHGLGVLWLSLFVSDHEMSWVTGFGLRLRTARSIALGLGVTLVALPVATMLIGNVVSYWLKVMGMNPEAQRTVTLVRDISSVPQLFVLGFAAIVLAPLVEEALFRGVIFRALHQRGHRVTAWIGTSLLFAAVHGNLAAFFPLVFLALVFAWLYHRTGNLLASMAGHALFNGLNFWLLVAEPKWLEKVFGQ